MPELFPTPAQTVGPFFGYALEYPRDNELALPGAADTIVLHGVVTDGAGEPVPDCLLELWQADESGAVPSEAGSLQRDGMTFTGWGRCATDREGRFRFFTRLPGRVDDSAPFFSLCVFARGLLDRVFTRAYLSADDVPDTFVDLTDDRRRALVARPDGAGRLRFDIRLQGDDQSVFLRFGPDRAATTDRAPEAVGGDQGRG